MQKANPVSDWLGESGWDGITELDKLQPFSGIVGSFESMQREWKSFFTANAPESESLPGDWDGKVSDMQRMVIVRVLRPDRLQFAATRFVQTFMGAKFVDPPPFDLERVFRASVVTTPLIFILSPGVDPTKQLLDMSKQIGVKVDNCALGQGQGPVAERMLSDGTEEGNWVFLSNCHLMLSWMPTLEKICVEHPGRLAGRCVAGVSSMAQFESGPKIPDCDLAGRPEDDH
jgi:dynein heavy chain